MRYMIAFQKGECVRYVSHLDLMRAMQRALRRAKLPVSYSQGYHPHQILSFAMALPVGAASLAEYMDVSMEKPLPAGEIASRLGAAMPEGWKITGAWQLEENDPSLMSLVDASGWKLLLPMETAAVQAAAKALLAADSCPVAHTTPKGDKVTDIRPGVLDLRVEPVGAYTCVTALLAAGSRDNIAPHLLVKALGGEAEDARILRTELYHKTRGGRPVPFRDLAAPF